MDATGDIQEGEDRALDEVTEADTGEYEGLPDATPEINLEETQVMRVRPSSAELADAESHGHDGGIGWQYIWGVAIFGTALGIALVYALK